MAERPLTLDSGSTTLARLFDALGVKAEGVPLVADLTLGSWRQHQAARECAAQLGIEFAHLSGQGAGTVPDATQGGSSFATLIGDGIDAEAQGRGWVKDSIRCAETIGRGVGAGRHTFVVLAPRLWTRWARQEVVFVRHLAEEVPVVVVGRGWWPAGETPTGLTHVALTAPPTTYSENHDVQRRLPVQLVPGLVPPTLLAILEADSSAPGLIQTGSLVLVDPRLRQAPQPDDHLIFDRLAAAVEGNAEWAWLYAYAQVYGSNFHADPAFLLRQAWSCFRDGDVATALALAGRARECVASPHHKAAIQAHEQGMRIASQSFVEAAAICDPPHFVAGALARFLLESKAWGLVTTGRGDEALPILRDLSSQTDGEVADLYLLNIRALAEMRTGHEATAQALEDEIEARHAETEPFDWRLEYINCLNQARLARRRRDANRARDYFKRAFASANGVRPWPEALYATVILGRLDADHGDYETALLALLRAALYWLNADCPAAVGLRTAKALIGHPVADTDPVVALVSAALDSELRCLAEATLGEVGYGGGAANIGQCPGSEIVAVAGTHGLVLLAASPRSRTGRQWGAEWESLRAAVAGVLARLMPSRTQRFDFALHQPRGDFPVTRDDGLLAALRLGLDRVWWDEEVVEVDEARRAALVARLKVTRGCGVQDVRSSSDGRLEVRFKRFLPPMRLGPEDAHFYQLLAERGPVAGGLLADDDALERLWRLEQARLVDVDLRELP